MHRTLRKLSKIISAVLFLVCIFSVVIFVFFEKSLSFQLEVYAKKSATNIISSQINKVVISELEKSGITYDKIINVDRGDDGKITAIRADMMSVNTLKANLDAITSNILEKHEKGEVKIPIGNLLGRGVFYGKGFNITIKFRPIGSSSTRMTGDFTSVGINQTIYRIAFDVTTDVAIVFPFRYVEMPLVCEIVIAETIIVGDVPESFTHFDLEGDITSQDFQGYVEDYMAE